MPSWAAWLSRFASHGPTRATNDVDAVVDETSPPDAVEALLGRADAEPDSTADHRVWVGGTKVESIGVGPVEQGSLEAMTERQTLFVAAHTWAVETATVMTIVAAADPDVRAAGPFGTPAALCRDEAPCHSGPTAQREPGQEGRRRLGPLLAPD